MRGAPQPHVGLVPSYRRGLYAGWVAALKHQASGATSTTRGLYCTAPALQDEDDEEDDSEDEGDAKDSKRQPGKAQVRHVRDCRGSQVL